AGRAVVRGRLADEMQAPGRAGAGRVEEVAVARDRVGSKQPASARRLLQLGLLLLVEERGSKSPPREATFFEAQDEDDLEAASAGTQEIEHGDAAGLAGAGQANGGVVEQPD